MNKTRVTLNEVELDLLDDAVSYYRYIIDDQAELDPEDIEWREKRTANLKLSVKLEQARRRVTPKLTALLTEPTVFDHD